MACAACVVACGAVLLFSLLCISSRLTSKSRPNIIVIVADDVGWNDISYHGSDQIATPNIDALGYHGVILERHYTQQVCTPSRAAFLTGQYPIRIGFQGYPLGLGLPKFIPQNVNTLPKSLKTLGYQNHLIGKWHLGYAKKEHTPVGYGYDSHFGYWNGYIGYFNHALGDEYNGTDLHDNYIPVTDKCGQYATDIFTERAVKIIKNHPSQDSLHLVISHLAGHTGRTIKGIQTELEVQNITATNERYSYIKEEDRRKYAEIIEKLDQSVGDVVEALANKDMLKNSIIVFFSDNGAPTYGMHGNSGSNFPLRGIKMTMYEGGIRTPAILYSPMIKDKGQIFNGLFHISDWAPTLFKAAGGNINDLGSIDGIDQWDNLIKNQTAHVRTELLVDIDPKFNYSAYIGYNGRYKLVNNSYFSYNYTGEEGFSNIELHYKHVKTCKSNVHIENTIPSHAHITLKQLKAVRDIIKLNCTPTTRKQQREVIQPCDGICLYDLVDDPCEYNDIAFEHPDIVEELSFKVDVLRREAKAKPNLAFDVASDPKLCNNTWFNWLDEDGCWYNVANQVAKV